MGDLNWSNNRCHFLDWRRSLHGAESFLQFLEALRMLADQAPVFHEFIIMFFQRNIDRTHLGPQVFKFRAYLLKGLVVTGGKRCCLVGFAIAGFPLFPEKINPSHFIITCKTAVGGSNRGPPVLF